MDRASKKYWSRSRQSSNVIYNAYLMRRACYAGKSGDWEVHKKAQKDRGEISEWAFMKVKESYDMVGSEDIYRLSIAQDILRKSTGFLRESLRLQSSVGGVTLPVIVLNLRAEEVGSRTHLHRQNPCGG